MSDLTDTPVLLLHGTNGAAWTMANFHAFYEEAGFACQSLTYRHHNIPPGPERDEKLMGLSIADYVEDAEAAIAKLGEKPIVIGHSLGGLVTQLLAAKGLLRAGILLNSSIIHGTLPTTDRERELGKMFISAGAFWDQVLGQDLELLAEFGLNTLKPDLQQDIYERLDTESGRVLFEFVFWAYDVNRTTFVDIDAVDCPLLFLSGSEDNAVPPSTARDMAARYGEKADFVEITGGCHYMQFDDHWPDIAATSMGWLKGL